MTEKLTVQEMIMTLQNFWSSNGCMLMQAYDTEKGAGTMSPYTFLRAIGPEPWNAAYVEPSRRPADGRYGENPNRLYHLSPTLGGSTDALLAMLAASFFTSLPISCIDRHKFTR